MEYPKQLRIGYRNYNLEFGRDVALGNMGESQHIAQKVRINTDYIQVEQANTLLHEALHCIYDINLPSTDEYKKIEEEIVTQLTHGLIQMIQDNPKVIEFIINAANDTGIKQSTD